MPRPEKVEVELEGRVGQFTRAMDEARERSARALGDIEKRAGLAEGSLVRFGARGATALGAAATAFTAATLASTRYAASIERVSQQTGASIENLQRVRSALGAVGIAADTTDDFLVDLQERLGEAINTGAGEAVEALEGLGLSLDQLRGRDTADQLSTVVDAMLALDDQSRAAAFGAQLLGGEGNRLGPILTNLAEEGRSLSEAMDGVSIVLSDDTVAAATDAQTALDRLFASVRTRGVAAFAELSPEIEAVANLLQRSLDTASQRANDRVNAADGDPEARARVIQDQIARQRQALNGGDEISGGSLFALARRGGREARVTELEAELAIVNNQITAQARLNDLINEAAGGSTSDATELAVGRLTLAEQEAAEAAERRAAAEATAAEAAQTRADAEAERAEQQAATEAQILERLLLRNELDVARAAKDEEAIEALEEQLQLLTLTEQFEAGGLDAINAKIEAQKQLNDLRQAGAAGPVVGQAADSAVNPDGTARGVGDLEGPIGDQVSNAFATGVDDFLAGQGLQEFSGVFGGLVEGDFTGALQAGLGVLAQEIGGGGLFGSILGGVFGGLSSVIGGSFGGGGGGGGLGGIFGGIFGGASASVAQRSIARAPGQVSAPQAFQAQSAGVTNNINLAPGLTASASPNDAGGSDIDVRVAQVIRRGGTQTRSALRDVGGVTGVRGAI